MKSSPSAATARPCSERWSPACFCGIFIERLKSFELLRAAPASEVRSHATPTEVHLQGWHSRGHCQSRTLPLSQRSRGGRIHLPRHSRRRSRASARSTHARSCHHRPIHRRRERSLSRGSVHLSVSARSLRAALLHWFIARTSRQDSTARRLCPAHSPAIN